MAVIALASDLSNRATANSYQTLAEAEAYWETQRDRANFLTFSEVELCGSLITAAALMNQLPWDGQQDVEDAALAFPRRITIPASRAGNFSGRQIAMTEEDGVPALVVRMQAELAYHLLQNPGITTDTGGLLTNASLSVGSIEINSIQNASTIPQFIRTQLRIYLQGGSNNAVFVGA